MTEEQQVIEIPDRGHRYIARDEELGAVVEVLSTSPVLGIDTESDSLFSYRESCCLVQITGVTGPDFIIDPLSVSDLSPLGPLMENPDVVKIFHGADFDIVSMKRDFGFRFCNIFDTMIAAQATGHERFGLFDLVSRYFGVTLNKKYQRHDWSSRPLKSEHLDYARLDSHYLPTLMGLLADQAAERGRTDMLTEEFGLLEGREWTGRPYHPNDCIRIKGASKLEPDQLRVLRAVCDLRNSIAADRDRPSFKVWGNDACIKLAQRAPKDRAALREALGDNHHIVRRYSRDVVAAVNRGTEDNSPPPTSAHKNREKKSSKVPPFTREHEGLLTHLRKWRNRAADEAGLGPGMVVNNNLLKTAAALQPKQLEQLELIPDIRRWQIKEWGPTLLEQIAEYQRKAKQKAAEKAASQGAEKESKSRRRRRRRRSKDKGPGTDSDESTDSKRSEHETS
ncbi:MAG: hypothetical protein CMP23_16200 [Rickettsiales bacterium]|nr:hypothetical protein [Rickettsiales bacterium]|tara:strand:+ start:717 stop:2069 length:1353 start_codon:yes stop_codon:yes gene_type:complete